jgi:hypothetical protein
VSVAILLAVGFSAAFRWIHFHAAISGTFSAPAQQRSSPLVAWAGRRFSPRLDESQRMTLVSSWRRRPAATNSR